MIVCGIFAALFAADPPPARKPAVKKPVVKKAASPKTATKTATTKKKGKAPARPVASNSWRPRQLSPTPDRYKEIQQALASKGYLKSEPSGVWDADSTEAMKQFQTDRNLTPTGKITAPALIGLGLGPKPEGSETPVAAPPQ